MSSKLVGDRVFFTLASCFFKRCFSSVVKSSPTKTGIMSQSASLSHETAKRKSFVLVCVCVKDKVMTLRSCLLVVCVCLNVQTRDNNHEFVITLQTLSFCKWSPVNGVMLIANYLHIACVKTIFLNCPAHSSTGQTVILWKASFKHICFILHHMIIWWRSCRSF